MQKKYEVIMTLDIGHEYYSNSELPGFSILVHPITGLVMKNHRVILKQKRNVIILLQEGIVLDGEWSPTIEFKKPELFTFQFKANDASFQNKTDLEFHANKDKKFFIDLDEKNKELETTVLSFYQGPFAFDNIGSNTQKEFLVKSKKTSLVRSLKIPAGEIKYIDIEIPGEYTLYKDNQRCYDFIWSTHDNQFDGYLSATISHGLKKELDVVFPSKRLRWKYIVNSKYTKLNDQLTLKEESDKIQFKVESLSTKQASFISNHKIKLKERYDFVFSLEIFNDLVLSEIGSPSISDIALVNDNVDKIILVKYVHV